MAIHAASARSGTIIDAETTLTIAISRAARASRIREAMRHVMAMLVPRSALAWEGISAALGVTGDLPSDRATVFSAGIGCAEGGERVSKREQTHTKRQQILDAAASLLSSKGLQALSFENVAQEAGLSRQLVRYYYPDLDGLIVDLCDHLAGIYRELLVSGIVTVGKVERLDFFLDFFFDLADGYPMPVNLEAYDAMIAYSVGSESLRDRMCGHYRTLGQVVLHELAIAYPQLSAAACEELSFIFVSMMHAHWSFVASLGYSRQHGRLARSAIDRLIRSYLETAGDVPEIEKPWQRGD